jgi:phage-related minor tail protein
MATMDSLNQRLDSLVGRMNRASGNQKVQAMATVINELVAQRKVMQERMHRMMGGRDRMMKMMGDSTAVTPNAGARGADSAASDTAGHAGHHPPK